MWKLVLFLSCLLMINCTNTTKSDSEINNFKMIPITTKSAEAKDQFLEAQRLVQNGLNGNPTDQYKKAILLDSTFVRMYNFISIYAPNDSIKKENHEMAKKYKHLASKEEQMLVDATEYRFKNPKDVNEKILFDLTERCPSDKYLCHTISYLLFRKNPKFAIKAGLKAIEIDNKYPSGYNILGYAYINNEEFEKAEEAFNNYIKFAPNKANPYDSKADLLKQLGRYEEALMLKKKAFELDGSLDWIPEEILELELIINSKPKG